MRSGDLERLAGFAIEAINSGDYSLVEGCVSHPQVIEELRQQEYLRPLRPVRQWRKFPELTAEFECWTQGRPLGFTISININPGSASGYITGVKNIGGGA